MADFDLNIIARKSVTSFVSLTSRTFLVQLLGILASFILTIYLSPSDFGVFFIVSSLVVFLNYFSDIGLAASLIQKKAEPTLHEFRTTFTIQQILVLTIVIPAFFLSGKAAQFFDITGTGIYLFYAFLVSFLLSSLKTIPTVMLERRLDFHKLVIPQIAENVVYNVILIIFAVKGFGITSFTVAVLLRSIVGLVAIYIVQPWRVGFALDFKVFRDLIKFGFPYQINGLLALIKDDLINIYIGKILPLTQVGYIGFAQRWAFLPLRLVMDNVIKIMFPSLSRLQHDKEALKIVIEKSLLMISLFIFPTAVGLITLSPYFIEYIPNYQKWQPAIIALTFFSLNTVFGSLSTPITNALYAIGRIKITVIFMSAWTILIWILTPLFIKYMGFNGVAVASFLVSVSTLTIYFAARRYVAFSFIKPIIKPLITATIMLIFILIARESISSLLTLLLVVILSGVFYFLVLFVIMRRELKSAIRLFRNSFRK